MNNTGSCIVHYLKQSPLIQKNAGCSVYNIFVNLYATLVYQAAIFILSVL